MDAITILKIITLMAIGIVMAISGLVALLSSIGVIMDEKFANRTRFEDLRKQALESAKVNNKISNICLIIFVIAIIIGYYLLSKWSI